MFKSENVRTLIKILLVISCITAVIMVILGIALIAVGDSIDKGIGIGVLVTGLVSPLSSFLGLYSLYALSQIETNTAETNKKLNRLIKLQKSCSAESRGNDWGSFANEEDDNEERPEPLYDNPNRYQIFKD